MGTTSMGIAALDNSLTAGSRSESAIVVGLGWDILVPCKTLVDI